MLPRFLIIGAQKSATSVLQAALAEHPQVYMPRGEIPFFEDPDYGSGDLLPLQRLYTRMTDEQVPGLKRPNYLGRPECPARIKHHIPEAKLIVVLRNPVDRLVSAYFHYMRHSFLPLADLHSGVSQILSGAYAASYPRAAEVLEFGLYGRLLRRYLEHFDRSAFFIVTQQALLSDLGGTWPSVCQFLSIDGAYQPRAFSRRVNQGVYSLLRQRLHRASNPLRYRYTPDLRRRHRRRASVPERAAAVGLLGADRLLSKLVADRKPELDAGLRQRVIEYYRDDITEAEKIIQVGLSSWMR